MLGIYSIEKNDISSSAWYLKNHLEATSDGGIFVVRVLISGLRKDTEHLEDSTLLRYKNFEDIAAANQKAIDVQFQSIKD